MENKPGVGSSQNYELESLFQQLANAIDQVFWFLKVDPEQVLYVSPAFEQIWGITAEQIYKNPRIWTAAIHPVDQERVSSEFSDWICGEIPEYRVDYRIVRPDGSIRWIRDQGVQVWEDQGKLSHLSGIAKDITEQKKIEDRLSAQQSEMNHVARLSMLGEMAAGLAHELNQPLTAMSALAEGAILRLERENLNQEEFITVCQRIAADARRSGEIIRRLRNFVQKRKAERSLVDINELIQDVINFTGSEIKQDEITVEVVLSEDPQSVYADAIEIQQVVVNLIRNACDSLKDDSADNEQRRILVEVMNRDDSFVEVVVSDSGAGIPESVKDRLYEPFLTTKEGGMGIGLGICKSIIEAHHGTFWTGPSELGGACFHFDLPFSQEMDESEVQ